jgi:hypothetical protein
VNEHARIWGDPHIDEADGGKYDFQQVGLFSVLKDKNMALNVNTVAGGQNNAVTLINKSGVVVGSRTVQVDSNGKVTVGYADSNITTAPITLQNGQTVLLDSGSSITKNNDKVTLQTPEYKVQFDTGEMFEGIQHMNIDVWTKAGGVFSDGVAPTGLLGETFDDDTTQQTGTKQSVASYAQSSLFDRSVATSTTTTTASTANTPATSSTDTTTTPTTANNNITAWRPSDGRSGFIRNLYRNAFGNDPQTPALNAWTSEWGSSGLARPLKEIYGSSDFKNRYKTEDSQVDAMYTGILQRHPNTTEASTSKTILETSGTDGVVDSLINSDEYTTRVQNGTVPAPSADTATTTTTPAPSPASTTTNTDTTTTGTAGGFNMSQMFQQFMSWFQQFFGGTGGT